MNLFHTLSALIADHTLLAYLIIFLAIVIEGELILITAGVLAHVGIVPIGMILFIGYLGAVAKMSLGYYMGMILGLYFPHNVVLRYAEHKVLSFLPRFKERPFWSIFLSKFLYGINNLVIIFAGYTHARLKTYFKAEILSSVLWTPFLFFLGYFFSYTAFGISRDIRKAAVFILIFLIMFLLVQKVVNTLINFFEEYENK